MSIGKRVFDAIERMQANDPEGALFAICAALEATAVKEFSDAGRSSYKKFILHNLRLITEIGFGGVRIGNLRLAYTHPEMKATKDGTYPIEEIFYHAVRCGLYHKAELPQNLRFTDQSAIHCNHGALELPASFVHGFIVAVVVAPTNATEMTDKPCFLKTNAFCLPINKLWGRRDELLWLLDACREMPSRESNPQQVTANPVVA